MKAPSDISPDITTLKRCDHQAFFEALDSPGSPTEALCAAFRRRKHFRAGKHDFTQSDE